jgi:hypothetical protein
MDELVRQKRVLNMMITMHSILRDRYKYYDLIANILLLVSAVTINTLVFASDEVFTFLALNPTKSKIAIGIFSSITFALSIIYLLVNWKEKMKNHGDAVIQLSILLNECRGIEDILEGQEKNSLIVSFGQKYSQITNMLIKIPDSKFNYLKSRHYRKLELSKLIDSSPSSPLFFLKARMFFNSFKNK